jgi:hypothetical protein
MSKPPERSFSGALDAEMMATAIWVMPGFVSITVMTECCVGLIFTAESVLMKS